MRTEFKDTNAFPGIQGLECGGAHRQPGTGNLVSSLSFVSAFLHGFVPFFHKCLFLPLGDSSLSLFRSQYQILEEEDVIGLVWVWCLPWANKLWPEGPSK